LRWWGTHIIESTVCTTFIYSADSGVDGPAVLPDVTEKKS
jgi:hypothetical protein